MPGDDRNGATRLTAGVIGGLGPAATVDFMRRVMDATPADSDQEHVRLLVDQNPAVPNRQRAIIGDGEDPGPVLAEMAHNLERAGADFIVMPCNTAHAFAGTVTAAISVPFVSIVDATMDALPDVGSIGVLETPALAKAGLYRDAISGHGCDYVSLGDQGCETLMRLVYAIKAGDTGDDIRRAMRDLAQGLAGRGAGAIIVGCTEVPLVLADDDVTVPLICSTEALARRTVALATGELPLPDRKTD